MMTMGDWQSDLFSDLFKAVDDFATGVEDFVTEVSTSAVAILEQIVQASLEASEEIATEVTDTFSEVMKEASTEFSTQAQTFLDTDLEAFLNEALLNSGLYPLTIESIEAWINTNYNMNFNGNPNASMGVPITPHPLCADCKNFHGQAYNDVSLVCGMHPYGIAEGQSTCDDREQ
jgi:hypothetical protein